MAIAQYVHTSVCTIFNVCSKSIFPQVSLGMSDGAGACLVSLPVTPGVPHMSITTHVIVVVEDRKQIADNDGCAQTSK